MSKCPNCGSAITCGCQRRMLSNGRAGCTKCIGKNPTADQKEPLSQSPVVNNSSLTEKKE
jgi:hypothetical protein